MKIINVLFTNFWPKFNSDYWIDIWNRTYHHTNIFWTHNTNTKPDILISSVFGSLDNIKYFDGKKILYTRENLEHNTYHQYLQNLDLFDLVIGFEDKFNQINIPYYYDYIKIHNIDIQNVNKNYTNRNNICLISTNPHKLRLKLLEDFLNHNVHVDCPSLVGKNMNIIVDDKLNFIQNYYFNICPENSYANGYTTEKLFDCCISGCVPIYYGCEGLNDGFYNKDRILHIKKDLSNYDQIVDRTLYLLNHKNELIEFMNQNPFAINYQDYISNIKQKIHNSLEQLLLN